MPSTPMHDIIIPSGTASDVVPQDLARAVIGLERFTMLRFDTVAARNSWFAAADGANSVEGPYCAVISTPTRKVTIREAGQWRTIWADVVKTTLSASSNITGQSCRIIYNEADQIVHLDGWVQKTTNGGFTAASTLVATLPYAHRSAASFRWIVAGQAADGSKTQAMAVVNGNYGDDANQLNIIPYPGAPKTPITVWLDAISYSIG